MWPSGSLLKRAPDTLVASSCLDVASSPTTEIRAAFLRFSETLLMAFLNGPRRHQRSSIAHRLGSASPHGPASPCVPFLRTECRSQFQTPDADDPEHLLPDLVRLSSVPFRPTTEMGRSLKKLPWETVYAREIPLLPKFRCCSRHRQQYALFSLTLSLPFRFLLSKLTLTLHGLLFSVLRLRPPCNRSFSADESKLSVHLLTGPMPVLPCPRHVRCKLS